MHVDSNDYFAVISRNGEVEADMRQLRISRAWHFPDHLEFQLGMVQSINTTVGFDPVLRWNFLEHKRWRLFGDGGMDLLQTGSIAYIIPGRDVGYNLFSRARAGAIFRLHESCWLETSFGWAHVTAGFGGKPVAVNGLAKEPASASGIRLAAFVPFSYRVLVSPKIETRSVVANGIIVRLQAGIALTFDGIPHARIGRVECHSSSRSSGRSRLTAQLVTSL